MLFFYVKMFVLLFIFFGSVLCGVASSFGTMAGASMAAQQACRARILVHSCACPWLARAATCKGPRAVVAVLAAQSCLPIRSSGKSRRLVAGSPVWASLGQAGPAAGFASQMADKSQVGKCIDPVVSVEWLHQHLGDPNIKVLDASWYMPNEKRNPFQEYKVSHIPGALFFDVDGVVDNTSNLPHMLPSESAFSAAVSSLGICNSDTLVVYDGAGIFSAARVWWMFRAFGHDNVVVLDGGLPRWRAAGFDVESSTPMEVLEGIKGASESVKRVYQGRQVDAPTFEAKLQPHLVWSLEQVKCNIEEKNRELIDARSKARFDGVVPEPRKGIRGGHIPGSKCVPFNEVLKDGATLLSREELENKFKEAGVELSCPIVTSCGTGVTACVLALALHRIGNNNVAVYDGSWTEWGGKPDTPVATNSLS